VLTRVFTPELVDGAVDAAGARQQRRGLLSARLVVYFVLALWLYRGRNAAHSPDWPLQRQGHPKIVSNRFAETIFVPHP
jgi:hypothetical protein